MYQRKGEMVMRNYDFYTDCFQHEWNWYSNHDTGENGHILRISEGDISKFVAEQVSRFTRYIMDNLFPVAIRKDFYPFNKIAAHDEGYVVCPHCGEYMTEEEWDNSESIQPVCLACHGEINMRKT